MSDEVTNEDASEIYEHKYLSSFNIGDNYVGVWRVKSTEVKVANGGKNKYTEYYFQDKSDVVKAVFFGMATEIKEGDFALVDLSCQDYQGSKSFKVHKILPNNGIDATPISPSYYLDVFDVTEYNARLEDVINGLGNNTRLMLDFLKQYDFLQSDGSTILKAYPSNNVKYNKAGGAIAHSVSLAEACIPLASFYGLSPYETAVIVGACLVGRIGAQYCFDQVNEVDFVPNKSFHLCGVENISARMVAREIDHPELAEFRDRVLHCLVSNEITDCKPLTKEAFLYTKLVYMDTLLRGFSDSYNKSSGQNTEFSMKDPDFKRQFYIAKPEPYVVEEEVDSEEVDGAVIGMTASGEVEKVPELVLEACATSVPNDDSPPF